MLTRALIFSLGVLFLLESCAPTLPGLKKNHPTLPEKFPHSSAQQQKSTSGAEILWKDFFALKELKPLIEEAIRKNIELHLRDQEIRIRNNEVLARQGEYLPMFSATASGGVEKAERFSTEDANEPVNFTRVGLSASWEIDIWKKLRNATKSAHLHYLSTIEGRRYVVTGIVAEVANTYFELLAIDNSLKVVDTYVGILSQIRQMVQLQQIAGRVTSLAVKRFEAEVLKNQARLFELRQKQLVTENKLNVLLGRFPKPIPREPEKFLDYSFSTIGSSVPSKLLENRPDIREALLGLEAAKLDVAVAKARFYPSLSIDGEYGYEQFNGKHFDGTVSSIFYGLAAGITMPVLNRKAIKADYYSANSKQIQALYNYELALISGYTEVTNQLFRVKNFNKIFDLKSQEVRALNQSISISNMLFKAARVDYVEALFTQRDALEAQLELIETKKEQLTASVDLYRALGGGWKGISEAYKANY